MAAPIGARPPAMAPQGMQARPGAAPGQPGAAQGQPGAAPGGAQNPLAAAPQGVQALAAKEMQMLFNQTREQYSGQGFQVASSGEKGALQALAGGGGGGGG